MSALLALFSNPAFLPGVLLAAAPVAIHLLSRRRATRLPFPTLRFLRQTAQRTASRRRLEEWLLLLLRTLAIVCIALALAKPVLRVGATGSSIRTVAVLDTSLSVQQEAEGLSVWERLRQATSDHLRSLPTGSRWGLGTVAGPLPRDDLAQVRSRDDKARTLVDGMQPTAAAGDLPRALAAAVEALRAEPAARRELLLATDGQAAGWEGLDPTIEALRDGEPVDLFLFMPSATGGSNVTVEAVKVAVRAPLPGEEARIETRLHNHADREVRTVARLEVDGQEATRRAVVLPARGSSTLAFELPLTRPGWIGGSVRIERDANAADNVGYFALEVRRNLTAWIVEDDAPALPREQAAFYWTAALSPFGGGAIQPRRVEARTLATASLAEVDLIVLVGLREPPAELHRLREWVQDGGRLVLMPSETADAALWNQRLSASADASGSLLPAELGELKVFGEDAAPHLEPGEAGHPLVSGWQSVARESLRRVRLEKAFALHVPTSSPARIALTSDGGEPFVVSRTCGKGFVVLWAAPARPDWTNLQARPVFVPLAHAHLYLGRDASAEDGTPAGLPLPLYNERVPAEVALQLQPPSSDPQEIALATASRERPALYADTWQAGLYRGDYTKPAPGARWFAVNPAAASEGDLTTLDPAALSARLAPLGRVFVARSLEELSAARDAARQERDLGDPLLAFAALLLLGEAVWGARRARHALA